MSLHPFFDLHRDPARGRARKFSGLGKRTIYLRIVPQLKHRLSFDPKFRTYTPF